MALSLREACIYRLVEKGFLSSDCARILSTVFSKSGLNGLQLAEGSGLSAGETTIALEKLLRLGAIEVYAGKYFCTRKETVLMNLVEAAESAEVAVAAKRRVLRLHAR